jgi:hypothetical protein
VHTTGAAPVHAPFWQLSLVVQALPSLHEVPFGAAGLEHAPVAGSQVPATWHASDAVQVTGVPPPQAPFMQTSTPLQALPSEQLVPFATGVCVQLPEASHESAVHGLWSSQLRPAPGWQTPAWQVLAAWH